MDDEEKLSADQLPPGTTPPLWVDVPEGNSQRDVLEKISQLPEMRGLSTTVIYDGKENNILTTNLGTKWSLNVALIDHSIGL